jgi:predicted nucleic acid-binding protein
MVILDTNVLSELMKSAPKARVVQWIAAQPARSLFTTSITKAEILYGVMMLPTGRRRRAVEAAVEAMFREDFADRVLSFGGEAALSCARIAWDRRRAGRPISQSDAQIAAIALCAGATIATRNVADFEMCGVDVVNPWEAP